jgi:hypothetical protein
MYCTSKIGKAFTVLKMCLQIASKKQRYQQNDILQNIDTKIGPHEILYKLRQNEINFQK